MRNVINYWLFCSQPCRINNNGAGVNEVHNYDGTLFRKEAQLSRGLNRYLNNLKKMTNAYMYIVLLRTF